VFDLFNPSLKMVGSGDEHKLFNPYNTVSPLQGVSSVCVMLLPIFRPDGALNYSARRIVVYYPPFEGGGFFVLFAIKTEDDPNTTIPTFGHLPTR